MADEVQMPPLSSNAYMEQTLHGRLADLGSYMSSDVLVFVGPIEYRIDDLIRYSVESIENKRRKLVVLLETGGGYIEVAERVAETFRHHYRHVEFIVPNFAMSAGTVLAMAGDRIYMDYYSILGPIDPQIERPEGHMVPALGYLAKYDELIAKSAAGDLTTAELAYLIQHFDPAELHTYEQARNLSIELLKAWLVKYKFRNWRKTEIRRESVTKAMKEKRAEEIARGLNNTKRWKSHARGLSMEVLRKELKVKIDDFRNDQNLNSRIQAYYRLLKDYMARRGQIVVIHAGASYMALPV